MLGSLDLDHIRIDARHHQYPKMRHKVLAFLETIVSGDARMGHAGNQNLGAAQRYWLLVEMPIRCSNRASLLSSRN